MNGLECCILRDPDDKMRGGECPYNESDTYCLNRLKMDVLALLKAQEPRKPHYTTLEYVVNGEVMSVKYPECPRCWNNGLMLWDAEIEKGAAYCKRCGQAVKWDDT